MCFTQDEARRFKKQLDKLKTRLPPVMIRGKNLVLTAPALIAEIEYRGWTHDGKLSHPSLKGLGDEADAGDVYCLPES
ncbi:hypothetical protein [Rhizobium sp. LCM 4573]|uniref:ATP dependent DNA ligase n=1 Tax=Rhizobium sp. LCM 4573 TaxID=1848291 RepID=UPI00387EC03D